MKPNRFALTTILIIAGLTIQAQNLVPVAVSFAPADSRTQVNPEFCGLSYEKSMMGKSLFVSNNTAMINLFNQIDPGVLRIGANQVDKTCWNGLSGLKSITPAQVDAFAGFIKATQWRVIYGINMSVNTPANAASEASYAARALGKSLLGFEIGNECDCYSWNGIRTNKYNYDKFREEWHALAAAIHAAVSDAVLTGPADASNNGRFSVPFANDEAGNIAMVTSHYYRGNGKDAKATITYLLNRDTNLIPRLKMIVGAAGRARLPMGFRCDECGSYYGGGAPNVSNAYGTALWALDFMFINALNGSQGVNFHAGGRGPGYTPIADDGTNVVQVRPEYYGIKMFSLAAKGAAIPATVSLGSPINFTAYGVLRAGGGINAVLINKETNCTTQVTIELGAKVQTVNSIKLAGPSLGSTSGFTIGGAVINADGSWRGGTQLSPPAINGKLTINVPPISALLLVPD